MADNNSIKTPHTSRERKQLGLRKQAGKRQRPEDRDRRKGDRREKWDRRLPERRFAPGEYIFREGDKPDYGFVVVSGKVSIDKLTGNAYEHIIDINPGGLFGEMCIIDEGPRNTSAVAKEDTIVREVNKTALMNYFSSSPNVAIDAMKRLLVNYVRTTNKSLEVDIFNVAKDGESISQAQENKDDENIKHFQKMEILAYKSEDNRYIIDEFQNPADAIMKKRVPPVIRWTFITIFGFFASFILWASFSIIDVTLSAPSKLTTTVPTIDVQSGDASVVREVNISLGQYIQKGKVIAVLDPTLNNADLAKMQNEFDLLTEQIKRLNFEIQGEGIDSAKDINNQVHQDIFISRFNEYQSKRESLQISIRKARSGLEAAKGKLSIASLNLEQAELEYQKQQRLVKENIVHPNVLQESAFAVKKAETEVGNARIEEKIAKQNLSSSNYELSNYSNGRLKQLNEELSVTLQKHDSLYEDLIKIQHKRKNVEILAPTSGTILNMDKLYVSSIVSAGDVVATLVPTDAPLMVEMDIEPQSISNVVVGHEVSVKLTALPYLKHGDLSAKISYISEDTVDTSINGDQGIYFRARATIVKNRLINLPPGFHLIPGLQANGDIKISKRRLITYFLYPVIRTLETSFVEP